MLPPNLSTFPVFTTERLTLRKLSEADAAEIFFLRSDAGVNKYLGRKPAETTEDALQFIRNIINNEMLYWAVTETGKEKLIGTICMFDISETDHSAEIGYELMPAAQGNGFMQESARKIIEFAADELGIRTINAFMHKDNKGSINILQKLNFEKTKTIVNDEPDLILMRTHSEGREYCVNT